MVKAKEDFLWFKEGQDVPDSEVAKHPNWKQHLIGAEEIVPVVVQPSKVESKKEEKKKK